MYVLLRRSTKHKFTSNKYVLSWQWNALDQHTVFFFMFSQHEKPDQTDGKISAERRNTANEGNSDVENGLRSTTVLCGGCVCVGVCVCVWRLVYRR